MSLYGKPQVPVCRFVVVRWLTSTSACAHGSLFHIMLLLIYRYGVMKSEGYGHRRRNVGMIPYPIIACSGFFLYMSSYRWTYLSIDFHTGNSPSAVISFIYFVLVIRTWTCFALSGREER